jgi:hypothetical protein
MRESPKLQKLAANREGARMGRDIPEAPEPFSALIGALYTFVKKESSGYSQKIPGALFRP